MQFLPFEVSMNINISVSTTAAENGRKAAEEIAQIINEAAPNLIK